MILWKKAIMLLMSALVSAGVGAQPMTEQEAAERALEFLNHRKNSSRPLQPGVYIHKGQKVLIPSYRSF